MGGGQAWAQSQSFAGQAGLGAPDHFFSCFFLHNTQDSLPNMRGPEQGENAGPVFKKQEKNVATGIKGTKIESFCLSSVVLKC